MSESPPESARSAFPDTRWSLIVASRGDNTVAREALDEICRNYWYPVYGFARGLGLDPVDAEDATQGLFEKMIKSSAFSSRVSQEQGKLRSYLIASLKNFVNQERRRGATIKRGGQVSFISFDLEEAESRYLKDAVMKESPELLFERRWALAVLDVALKRLRKQYDQRNDGETFEVLAPLLVDAERGQAFSEAAEKLGLTEGAVRSAIFRLRKRFRKFVREEVAQTISDPDELEDEISALFVALQRKC